MSEGIWPKRIMRLAKRVSGEDYVWWQEVPAPMSEDSLRMAGFEPVEVVPVSALLSDESVAALAKSRYERKRQYLALRSWGNLAESSRRSLCTEAADDLQAAIEQVGGGPGGR